MATNISDFLIQKQTGEYIPSEEEKKSQEQLLENTEPTIAPPQGALADKYRLRPYERRNESLGIEAAAAGWGNSRFDRGEFNPESDIENKRALEQSGFSKIMNGAAKGGVYAATTALQTVAGVIDGLIEGTAEFVQQAANGEQISVPTIVGKGVDNFTARTMLNIQKMSEDWFPNYKTLQERSPEYQDEWLKHIFTANFIGDSFLKNFGFTVGAMVGGAAWAKGLSAAAKGLAAANLMRGVTAAAEGNEVAGNALKATYNMIRDAVGVVDDTAVIRNVSRASKALNKMGAKRELFGSVIAAMGEGTMEGVMARNEFMESYANKLKGEYLDAYNNLRQQIIDESNETGDDTYIRYIPRRDENGDIVLDTKELNKKGEDLLLARQKELAADYAKKRQWAEDQGNRIASTTFLLNLPILTASNTFQYGRMLSGDWKSIRKLTKVRGGIRKELGNITAEYAGIGGKAGKAAQIAGKALKLGAAEASEEMAQGVISAGARRVADARMTAFNDDGYDRRVLGDLGSWYDTMLEGGKEYLSDWKNWQEGFLGLVTGVVGIPGRRWQGGIAEAVRQVNKNAEGSAAAAAALNNRVNSDKFQKAWKGYVRHMKYENDMEEAAVADDQYAWQTANDEQLISDILLFANAGRLQDLKDIVESYTDMSYDEAEERGILDAVKSEGNATEIDNNPLETVERVKGHAQKIKDMIQTYSNMYDDMLVRAPKDASSEQIEEMIATAMNIKAFETRFLSMFDEVLTSIAPYMGPMMSVSREGEELATDQQKLQRAQDIYNALARVYTNTGIPESLSYEDVLDIGIALKGLSEIAENSTPALKKKIEDMKKVSDGRRAYLRKLLQLEKLSPDDFSKKAQNPKKVEDAIQEDKAQAETKGLQTVDDIKRAYQEKTTLAEREELVSILRTKAKTDNAAKTFIKTVDAYNNFRNLLSQMHPELINRRTGEFSRVAEILLGDALTAAKDESDLINKLNNPSNLESVNTTLQRMVEAGLNEEEALPVMVNQMYNTAKAAILDSIDMFKQSWRGTTGRENLGNSAPAKEQQPPVDDNANPPASTKPVAGTKPTTGQVSGNTSQPKEDKPKEEDNTPEPVNTATVEEKQQDAFASYTDDTLPEQSILRRDQKGAVKRGSYQQSIPEVGLTAMSLVRDLLKQRKTASKEEMEVIDQMLYAQPLLDFVQFEDGKPVGGETGYADNYKWLQENGAFEYIAKNLNKEDRLVFAIMSDAPLYEGLPQIVVAKELERNAQGEVSRIQPLTFLHSIEKAGEYMNLAELHDAIMTDINAREPDGDFQLFGGKENPITSRVFDKPAGIVRYDRNANGGERIDQKPSYDADAPIMILGKDNQPFLLRGNIDLSKVYLPNIYPWSADHYGRIYYLAKSGNGMYSPIFVDKKEVSSAAVSSAPEGTFLAKIKNELENIDNISKEVTDENADASNIRLKKQLRELNKLLNLDGVSFSYQKNLLPNGEYGMALNVSWGESDVEQTNIEPGTSVISVLDLINRPARISPKEELIDSSRRNLEGIISDGLLITDARELRQVGMNFRFDPWDPTTGTFHRLLPSETATESEKPIPESKPQHIATDAEFGDDFWVEEADVAFPETGVSVEEAERTDTAFSDTMKKAQELSPISLTELPYESLTDEELAILNRKKLTKESWNRADEETRKKYLGC